ncbi:MAG: NAD-dependent epimerase/dehydratase family protein [Deltaproteobacteria bacterium]|nr:NAD-dependent epimerase/dehydratase family protein [Deltaproteobacteria bacterium]
MIVVTGATGHVGANLVRHLLAAGHRVRAVVHNETRALAGLDVEIVKGDVRDRASLDAAFTGADVVYHLAACISIIGEQRGRVRAINVEGVRNAAEAARAQGVRRFVHCSSIHAFALADLDGVVDEASPRSLAAHHPAYDRSKAEGERALQESIDRGLDAVVCHPTGIIGPNDFGPSRMGRFLLALSKREMPALVAGGFDWVDVRDVVEGLVRAGEQGDKGEHFIFGGGHCSMRDMAALWQTISAVRAPRFVAPLALAGIGALFTTAYGRITLKEPLFTNDALAAMRFAGKVSAEHAKRRLGFSPRPLVATLTDTHAWFREHRLIDGAKVAA